MKINEGTRGYMIRFTCIECRYEQTAYVNVKPAEYRIRLGARFLCNECQTKQQERRNTFMDGAYNE